MYALEGTWKSEFTKKKADKKVAKLIRSVGVSQISSFVANSDKITMKLKSNSYFNLGYGDFNNEYDSLLQSYIFKWQTNLPASFDVREAFGKDDEGEAIKDD